MRLVFSLLPKSYHSVHAMETDCTPPDRPGPVFARHRKSGDQDGSEAPPGVATRLRFRPDTSTV